MFFKVVVLCAFTYISVCIAEPPRWRSSGRFSRLQHLEAVPGTELPVPHTVYGPPTTPSAEPPAPAANYGPPKPSYGPPPEAPVITTTDVGETTTNLITTTEVLSDSVTPENKTNKLQQIPTGSYYIYHPNGVLQKVSYLNNIDEERMSFDLKLKYENVDPISGPVYTYDPQTQVLQRVFRQV